MLTIRQDQVEAFRQHHLQKFEDEMVEHLAKFAPEHSKLMGEPNCRRTIRFGMERASEYGFVDRGPVRFYIDLMFMFGSYFDTDPQLPWASAVLGSHEPVSQAVRADRLFAAMKEYFNRIVEPERERLVKGLQGLAQGRTEDYFPPGMSREEALLQGVRKACPLRYEYLVEPTLRRLIRHGMEIARSCGFTSDKGVGLIVVMVFVLGHGFYKDPQYGWIARGLDSKLQPDADRRVEELAAQSKLYLDKMRAQQTE